MSVVGRTGREVGGLSRLPFREPAIMRMIGDILRSEKSYLLNTNAYLYV